jgi:hypothetical protein
MTSRLALTNVVKKNDKRMEDSLCDDESLIAGGGGNTLTITSLH